MSTKELMKQRTSNPQRNKELQVAQFAGRSSRQSKGQRRLAGRLADYATMMGTKDPHGGIQQRKDSGGFHRPGSVQQ